MTGEVFPASPVIHFPAMPPFVSITMLSMLDLARFSDSHPFLAILLILAAFSAVAETLSYFFS